MNVNQTTELSEVCQLSCKILFLADLLLLSLADLCHPDAKETITVYPVRNGLKVSQLDSRSHLKRSIK